MDFELTIFIQRPPGEVFVFLRDKDTYPREEGSPVLRLEKTTPGPVRVGTRYVEVVQMLPFYRGVIRSGITRIEPGRWLEEDFRGAGMVGHLSYHFLPEAGGTRLVQRESLHPRGLLWLFRSAVGKALAPRLQSRLEDIKAVLEGGYVVNGGGQAQRTGGE
jgi:hypothetical protein